MDNGYRVSVMGCFWWKKTGVFSVLLAKNEQTIELRVIWDDMALIYILCKCIDTNEEIIKEFYEVGFILLC